MFAVSPTPEAVNAALWLGALLLAAGDIADPFPAELERLAAEYFELYPAGGEGVRSIPSVRGAIL